MDAWDEVVEEEAAIVDNAVGDKAEVKYRFELKKLLYSCYVKMKDMFAHYI